MGGRPQRQHRRQGARPRRFALRRAGQDSPAQIAAARVQAARCAQGKGRAQAPPRPAATSAKARAPSQLMAVFRTLGLDGMFGEPDLRTVHQHSGKAFGPACTLIDLTDETCRWPVGEPGEADFALLRRRALQALSLLPRPLPDRLSARRRKRAAARSGAGTPRSRYGTRGVKFPRDQIFKQTIPKKNQPPRTSLQEIKLPRKRGCTMGRA